MKKLILFLTLITVSVFTVRAEVKLPDIFGDNMVLQQQSLVAFWGKAEPKSKILITNTWSKTKVNVIADENGDWNAKVQTPSAGGPYEVTINDGQKKTLKNVMIGEVWISMGQSNMDMQMRGYSGQPVEDAAEYILQSDPSVPLRFARLRKNSSLEPQTSCETKWLVNDPYNVSVTSAVSYFFARQLYECLRVPIGVINVSFGGSAIEAWMDRETIEKEFSRWFDMTAYQTGVLPKNPRRTPATLYNGMLHSIIPFTAKGFIWYQGCTNVGRHEQYRRLQMSFVKMLREKWGNDEMAFYFTQIAPYMYDDPNAREAAFLMWSQAQTLNRIRHSGMAVTHDIGEEVCIHPAKKKEVGDRLAFLALSKKYNQRFFDADPPIADKFEFTDGKAIVTFKVSNFGVGPIKKDLEGFEVAGEDKVFYPAVARVSTKDYKVIEVSCPEVPNPVAVRYGMRNWSKASVFSHYGIPASPFRSDDWGK